MKSSRPSVVACVVTYQPGPDLRAHLAALRPQVDSVIVIDNGSSDAAAVREAARAEGCTFVGNPVNEGVARALNMAVGEAQASGAEWLATFDQDSHVPEGAIAALLHTWAAHPARERVGIVAFAHQDRGTGRDYHHFVDILQETPDWRLLRTTITSGSVIRMAAIERIGGFEDALFIDSVDHEFCMRLRRRGWLILEDRGQVLQHSIGTADVHHLFGLRVVCWNHAPSRRYYITRNGLEVCLRNLLFDPAWATKTLLQLAKGNVMALVYEQDRAAKLAMIVRGLLDFALRRFGALR